jgi:4-amino-4-deoxy-L-arabinose transferase-like glycosyltransferase
MTTVARYVPLLLAVLTVLVLGVHLAFLTRYPPVFVDEPWYANMAWNLAETGTAANTTLESVREYLGGRDLHWLSFGLLSLRPYAASFALFGPGLLQARIVSLGFGAVLLGLTALVGGRIYGRTAGCLASLLLSLSWIFADLSHYVRPEIILTTLLMGALGIGIAALDSDRWWLHALAGLVMGVGFEVHLANVVPFFIGFAALYLVRYGWRVVGRREVWSFAAGASVGLIVYLAVHVLPHPAAFRALFGIHGQSHQMPILTLSPYRLLASAYGEFRRYFFLEHPLDFVMIGSGILFAVARHRTSDVRLLAYIGAAWVGFVLLIGNRAYLCAMLFYPFLMLIVAEGAVSLIRSVSPSAFAPERLFAVTLVALLIVSQGWQLASELLAARDYDYYAITDRIRSVIPQDARVMGSPTWWLGLMEYNYQSHWNLTYYHYFKGYEVEEGLEALRPDFVIYAGMLRTWQVDAEVFQEGPGWSTYYIPRRPFARFLAERGERVLDFRDPWHGRFEVYAIDWD